MFRIDGTFGQMGLSGTNFSTLPTSLVKLMSRFSVAYGGALFILAYHQAT